MAWLNQQRLALLCSLGIICLHIVLFGRNLATPGMIEFDEFLTLDRTLGLLRTGELFTTYTNCQPCWIKPPLHFYLGAASVKAGLTPVVGIRVWSVVFAALSLWLVALLTSRLAPERPWCAPTAVLFCSSSVLFAEYTRRAMMETGYVFFILLAIYGVARAAQNERYWMLWAMGCGLGTLHKVPIAWVLSLLWLFGLQRTGTLPSIQQLWQKPWFQRALFFNILISALWPVIQTLKYGAIYRRVAVSRWLFRMGGGVENANEGWTRLDFSWMAWLFRDSWLFWSFGIIVIAQFLRKPALRKEPTLWLLLPALPIVLGFTLAGGPFYPRYILTFTPLVCVTVAVLLGKLVQSQHLLPLIAVLVFFSSANELARVNYRGAEETLFDLRAATSRLSRHLRSDEIPIFLLRGEPFSAAYGNLARPIEIGTNGEPPSSSSNYLAVVKRKFQDDTKKAWPGRSELVETVGRYATIRLISQTDKF